MARLGSGVPVDRPVTQDTPASTVAGNLFTIPAGWSVSVKGPATIITPPEGGSHIVYVDVEAQDAESALAKAWAAWKEPRWPLKLVDEQADDNSWSRRKRFEYQTSPNERRGVAAGAMFANGRWTVWIYDVTDVVGGKRSAAIGLMFESLLPKGYERESFAAASACASSAFLGKSTPTSCTRLEHQGPDDAAARQARRRGPDRLEGSGHQADARLQAR